MIVHVNKVGRNVFVLKFQELKVTLPVACTVILESNY